MTDLLTIRQIQELASRVEASMRKSLQEQDELARTKSPAFSALAHFNNNETKQTELIASLLKPNGMHGQGTLFLRHFLIKAWPQANFIETSDEDFWKMKIRTEIHAPSAAEMSKPRRIDLIIQVDQERRLVVESKARDARDQWNQVTDYLHYISDSPGSRLIYLSWDGKPPEGHSIERIKWREEQAKGRAEQFCYPVFIGEWLEVCKKECGSARLKFFIEDLLAFTGSSLERLVMTPPNIKPLLPLLKEPLDDQSEMLARDTLLTVALLGEDIVMEIFKNFHSNLRAELERIGFICINEEEGLTQEEWGGLSAQPLTGIEEGLKSPAVTIQRCPPREHNEPSSHFVVGISKGVLQGEAELRRWQAKAALVLGEGTRDKKWIWQRIVDGFDNLRSKAALVRLLDPQTVLDTASQMSELLNQYHAIAEQVAADHPL